MNKFVQALKLYARLEIETIKYCLIREMEYRFNFVVTLVTVFAYQLTIFLTYTLLFSYTESIGNWTASDVSFLFATNAIIENVLFMPFAFYGLLSLPQLINTGNLDLILIKPVNPVFYISTKQFDLGTLVGGAISAVMYIIAAWPSLQGAVTAGNILVYIYMIINGTLIMHSLYLSIQCLAFRFIRIDAFSSMFWSIHGLAKRAPGSVYPLVLQMILTFFIPVLIVVYFPAGFVLNKLGIREVAASTVVTILFFILSRYIWRVSVKKYGSASS